VSVICSAPQYTGWLPETRNPKLIDSGEKNEKQSQLFRIEYCVMCIAKRNLKKQRQSFEPVLQLNWAFWGDGWLAEFKNY